VVYAGNLDPYQDVPDLIAALCAVPSLGLLVVSPSGVAALCQRARTMGLPMERLRAIETTRRADLADALAASAIAAVPRRICSGFPLKLLNLLGVGLPAVCAPGAARPIAGVVAVDGVPAMAAALAALAADPAARASLGAAARAAIAADWTVEVRARRLESFYAALCAEREGDGTAR
jgi:glycosyltransferase involved in cell wall biosynthesis